MGATNEVSGGQPRTPYDEYSGYKVYDENRENIGKVDDMFLDADDQPEYVGVKMGFLGSSSTLIPMEIVRLNDERELIQVHSDKENIKAGPAFEDDQEIDADYERRVREHYGLGESPDAPERGSYGAYYSHRDDPDVDMQYGERAEEGSGVREGSASGEGEFYDQYAEPRHDEPERAGPLYGEVSGGAGNAGSGVGSSSDRERGGSEDQSGEAGPGMTMGDIEGGEFVEHPPENEGFGERESDVEDEDELRVQRSEEELTASKREREAGKVNVRKRVRTDRERMTVSKKHEEVKVERVPVSGEASETDIGEQDVSMPVTEEEVEVTKRPVKKEEIRVRKESVEGEEVIEEDLRKEEVEVEGEAEDSDGR